MVEVPSSWYTEDLTPLAFYPHTANSHGYVDVRVIERMWWDRFNWLWENEAEDDGGFLFTLLFHPEGAGRSHIIGMIKRVLMGLNEKAKSGEGEVVFMTMEQAAREWRQRQEGKK